MEGLIWTVMAGGLVMTVTGLVILAVSLRRPKGDDKAHRIVAIYDLATNQIDTTIEYWMSLQKYIRDRLNGHHSA
jgi:hypothetical protein